MAKWMPPKRVRWVVPHSCGTCLHLIHGDGFSACERPGGPEFDTGDRTFDFMVCDRWDCGIGYEYDDNGVLRPLPKIDDPRT